MKREGNDIIFQIVNYRRSLRHREVLGLLQQQRRRQGDAEQW